MLVIILFFVAHWYLSLFMQTFLQHRYASHGAFTMSRFWEKFFYLIAYITQGSSYLSPRVYAIMHRMHHAYTDTEKDPHSPAYDKNLFAMIWRSRVFTSRVFKGKEILEPRFLKNLPDWPWLDKIGHSLLSRLAWIGVYIFFYIQFAPSAWWYLLIPIHILMMPVQGIIINWFAHKYGSRNFTMKNTSTNLFKVDILMMGEAYHNNHHKRPASTNFGFKWYEIDPTYFVIKLFSWLRIVRINTLLPVSKIIPATAPVIQKAIGTRYIGPLLNPDAMTLQRYRR